MKHDSAFILKNNFKIGKPPEFIIFHDVAITDKEYLRDAMKIEPMWLMDTAPHFYQFKNAQEKYGEPILKKRRTKY